MKDFKNYILGTILMVGILGTLGAATATFTYKTPGATDTSEVVSLVYPQKVPEDASVTTESIVDGSVTTAKIANDAVTADKIATGLNLLTDAEKTQALVGSSTVDFSAKVITATRPTSGKIIEVLGVSGISSYHVATAVIGASETISLDNLFNFTFGYEVGKLTICVTNAADSGYADFFLKDTQPATEVVDALNCFGVAANADDINVYLDGGSYVIQNHLAYGVSITATLYGSGR